MLNQLSAALAAFGAKPKSLLLAKGVITSLVPLITRVQVGDLLGCTYANVGRLISGRKDIQPADEPANVYIGAAEQDAHLLLRGQLRQRRDDLLGEQQRRRVRPERGQRGAQLVQLAGGGVGARAGGGGDGVG